MISLSTKSLTLAISTAFLLSACGGGSSNSDNSQVDQNNPPPPPTEEKPPVSTQNPLVFPITEFRIKAMSTNDPDFLFFLKENEQSNLSGTISEKITTLHSQDNQREVNWNNNQEYILTKDKLYTDLNSQHPRYVVSQTSGELILAFDADHTGLKSTLSFKNISLDQVAMNTKYVTKELLNGFGDHRKNDANWSKLTQKILANSEIFPNGSICHQYLTQQYDRDTISFGELGHATVNTLEEWVQQQRESGGQVVVDNWAGYQVAYVPNSQNYHFHHGEGYRGFAVVMKDGHLHLAKYDAKQVYDLREEYDSKSLADFNQGICNAYNKTAATALSTSFLNLDRN